MTPDQLKEFEQMKADVASLTSQVDTLKRTALTSLPAHFHKLDRIELKDLRGGFPVFTATPSQVAEEGACALYTSGSNVGLAFKVGGTWRYTLLT